MALTFDNTLAPLQWQVRAWIAWKCTEDPPAFDETRAESLLTFLAEIGETLGLPTTWTLPDIDRALGLPPGAHLEFCERVLE